MKYLVDIEKYESKSKRVNGFRRPAKVGLLVPSPMRIISGKSFDYWKAKGKLPPGLREEVDRYFVEAKRLNPHRNPYIGRGFYVPGMDWPPGPRTGGIKSPDDYLREIVSFYDFAVTSKFDVRGADIALLLHPFIHPYFPPLQVNPEVPYPGGSITPNIYEEGQVVIEVIWGHDEGVQALPHDTYIIDFERLLIVEKKIQSKTHALKAGSSQHYDEIVISPAFQTVQILNDLQIMQLASDYRKVHDKYGDSRMEFIVQPEGIVYRECTEFKVEKISEPAIMTNKKGKVTLIRTLEDVSRISKSAEIIAISPDVIKERNMDILTSVAVNAEQKLVILYPGTATTAHSATIFREQGHTLVYSGIKAYENDDFVEIVLERNELSAKIIKKNSVEDVLLSIEGKKLMRQDQVGGKAFRLSELAQFDVAIPQTFVIPVSVFQEFKKQNGFEGKISELATVSGKKLSAQVRKIQERIVKEKIPDALQEKLEHLEVEFAGRKLAIRSSASCEDGEKNSFAGQFDSFSPVEGDVATMAAYIKKVWASTYNLGALAYAKKNKISLRDIAMAVIIQEYTVPAKAGVMFTKNTESGSQNEVVIEAVIGHGEQVVDGTGTVSELVISKKKQEIKSKKGALILRENEIEILVDRALYIEKMYNKPQDIEWAISKEGKVVILQTRPITV